MHSLKLVLCVCATLVAELVKLWRAVTVEGIDENKIEDHLEKQGITSMQDAGPRTVSHRHRSNKNTLNTGKYTIKPGI